MASEKMIRLSIAVRGLVQGVGFRWFTRDNAESFNITGWVRNRGDGSVEAEAQGLESEMAKFLAKVGNGPWGSQVKSVDHHPMEIKEGEKGFRIVH